MRVLVTGGTGFIGSHTVAALRRRGHEVTVLARSPDRVAAILGRLGTDARAVGGDMTDSAAVRRALEGCDGVVHAAGEIGVDGGSGPAGSANVDGVHAVIGEAVDAGAASIVYTSTITAYLPTAEAVLTAESPLAEPLSAYGASKLEGEQVVRGWQDEGAPIASFVIGGVYGPTSPHLNGSFAATLAALGGFMFTPPGGLGVVDVRDIAELLARAVEEPGLPQRFMAGGQYVTWDEWTGALESAAGTPIGRQVISAEDMISLGRQFDQQRAAGGPDLPLSEEAAVIMTAGVPTDDEPTLSRFGMAYRPVQATFDDLVAYLRTEGHLPPP